MAWTVKEARNVDYAPLKGGIIAAALAAIFLLAAVVCLLHGINAVSLRGTAERDAYVQLATDAELLTLPIENGGGERVYTMYSNGEKRFALYMDDPWIGRGIVHIEGTFLRIEQAVGEVRVRAALLAQGADEAIVLNTQMVRRHEARISGYDDHCGFSAAVSAGKLANDIYQVILVDETDGEKNMIYTGVSIRMHNDGRLTVYRNTTESEEQDAQ